VSFFDAAPPRAPAPPAEPEDVAHGRPAWSRAAEDVVPGACALTAVVARTADTAIWLGDVSATPEGVGMTVTVARRTAGGRDPFWAGGLRLGVAFADGRKTELATFGAPPADPDPATDVVLSLGGGGGSDRHTRRALWLWPLPPPGPLTVAARWPEAGIEEAVVALDTAPIRDAAARAIALWPAP
jgi:hypothetical protein